RARAEKRLQATMELMSAAFEKAVPALNFTIGASKPRYELTKAGARIVEELLRDADPRLEMRQVVGVLYKNLLLGEVNYVGTTTGEFAEGLRAANQALQFLQPIDGIRLKDDQMHDLAETEMWAVFAARGMMQFQEAFEHLERMRNWGERLTQST